MTGTHIVIDTKPISHKLCFDLFLFFVLIFWLSSDFCSCSFIICWVLELITHLKAQSPEFNYNGN